MWHPEKTKFLRVDEKGTHECPKYHRCSAEQWISDDEYLRNYWRKPCAVCEREYWFEVDDLWSFRLGDVVVKPFRSTPA